MRDNTKRTTPNEEKIYNRTLYKVLSSNVPEVYIDRKSPKESRRTRRLKCDGNSKDDIFQTVHNGNLPF